MAVVVTGLKRLGFFLHLNDFVTGLWQLLVVNKTPFGAYGTSGADLTLLQIYRIHPYTVHLYDID